MTRKSIRKTARKVMAEARIGIMVDFGLAHLDDTPEYQDKAIAKRIHWTEDDLIEDVKAEIDRLETAAGPWDVVRKAPKGSHLAWLV